MKHSWFQDDDGTYYRNVPLIMAEMERCRRRPWRWRLFSALEAEWHQAWRAGLIRKSRLGRGDMLIQPAQFRDAYPDKPALWALDRNRQEAAP